MASTQGSNAGCVVAVENVRFAHRRGVSRNVVLQNLSHTFGGGTMTGLFGESGCGKTTLLKLLAQVYTPDSGIIRINNAPTSEESRRQTSYLPQDDILPLYLSVFEVFRHHSRIRRIRQSEHSSGLLESLGLMEFAKNRIGQLSGGQRKRVSIGLELLRTPKLLLLDEPTASLDPENASVVMEMLASIRARGVTIVIVSHRETDLKACDYVLELKPVADQADIACSSIPPYGAGMQ